MSEKFVEYVRGISEDTGVLNSYYIKIRMDILKEAAKDKYYFSLNFKEYDENFFDYAEQRIILDKLKEDGFSIPHDELINHLYVYSRAYPIRWEK